MSTIVKVDGVGKIKFPDSMSHTEIQDFLDKKYGSKRKTEGFWESRAKAKDQAAEDYAIGKLALENDKNYTIDLLENEFSNWKSTVKFGETPPDYWSMKNWGEMIGGVEREIVVGTAIGVGGAFVSTPVGGVAAGATAAAGMQAITAKGGSFRDAYNQIRYAQDQKGFVDKEAAYETARKISNNDAAIAALETGLSSLIKVPGIGKGLTRAITKPVTEVGFDAAIGGVGSVASDFQAESIGGDQGIDRGSWFDNAVRAMAQEGMLGLPSSTARSIRGGLQYGRAKKYAKTLEYINTKRVLKEKEAIALREQEAAETAEFRDQARAATTSEDAATAQLRRAALQQVGVEQQEAQQADQQARQNLEQQEATTIDLRRKAIQQRAEEIRLEELEKGTRKAQDEAYGTVTMAAIRGEDTGKKQRAEAPKLIEVPPEPKGLTRRQKELYHPTVIKPDETGKKPGKLRTLGANKAERDAARRQKKPRLAVPLIDGKNNPPDLGLGGDVTNNTLAPILDEKGNVILNPDAVTNEQILQNLGKYFRHREEGIDQFNQNLETRMDNNSDKMQELQKDWKNKTPEEKAEAEFVMESLSDENGRLAALKLQRIFDNETVSKRNDKTKEPTLKDLGKQEIKEGIAELGDLSRFGMGVDPTPVYKVIKGIAKSAAYYIARGVDRVEDFARKAGLRMGALVQKAWDMAVNAIPFKGGDRNAEILADLANPESTADGQSSKAIRELLSTGRDKAIQKLADKFIGLKRLQDRAANGKDIPDTNNTYQAEQLMHGRVGKLLTAFNEKADALTKKIADYGIAAKDIEKFLYALHARERNKHIREINSEFPDGGSGMTDAVADQIIERVSKGGKFDKYMEIADEIKEINDRTLDVQLEGGLITPQDHAALKGFYERYIPLRGHEDSDPRIRETGNHVNINSDFKKRENPYALGHGSLSKNLIAYAFEQHANAIARAERNRVYQTLLNWVVENPDNGSISIAEPTLKRVYKRSIGKVVKEPDAAWTNKDDVLALKVEGEYQYLRISDEQLAANLKTMGSASLSKFIQGVATFQRWLAMANTTLNPNFILPNFIRDVATAGINLSTEETSSILKDMNPKRMYQLGKGIWNIERGKKVNPEIAALYEQFKAEGGKMEFAQQLSLDAQIRNIDKYSTRATGLRGKAKQVAQTKVVKGIIGVMQSANSTAENTTRLAVFAAAMKSGKFTPKQAAFLARNATVNFTKKGEKGSLINSLYLFYNASIQGSLRIMQSVKSPRVRKLLYGIMTLGAVENTLNQMFGGEEDEDGFTPYDKIPEYIKQTNMIIPLPFTDKVVTIPLPYGYNTVYYAGKQITSVMPGLGGKKNAMDAASDLGLTAVNAFNPIGGSQNIVRALTPEIGKPIVDLSLNTDWKGDRIMPDRNPFEKYEIPDSERYWSTVSSMSKETSRLLNTLTSGNEHEAGLIDVSPETLDYGLAFLTGGVGKTVQSVVEGGVDLASGKGIEIEDIPVVRRFVESPSPYFEIQKYKELREEVNTATTRLKDLIKQKADRSTIVKHRKEKGLYLRLDSSIKTTDKVLSNINKSIQNIKLNPNMPKAQKSKKLEELNDKRRLILRKAIRKFVDAANR